MVGQTTRPTLLADLRRPEAARWQVAWHEFHARYRGLVRGFARGRGVRESELDDLDQDVFFALVRWMRCFAYDPARGRFRSYLKTVVVHEVERRRRRSGGDVARNGGRDVEELGRTALTAAWEREWRESHVRRALAAVQGEYRERDLAAFRRTALEEQDPRDVASALEMSIHQVYQARSRITRRLAEIVAQQVETEG